MIHIDEGEDLNLLFACVGWYQPPRVRIPEAPLSALAGLLDKEGCRLPGSSNMRRKTPSYRISPWGPDSAAACTCRSLPLERHLAVVGVAGASRARPWPGHLRARRTLLWDTVSKPFFLDHDPVSLLVPHRSLADAN